METAMGKIIIGAIERRALAPVAEAGRRGVR